MPTEIKTTKIKFDLRKSPGLDCLPIPLIVARGYDKKDVIECFKELQNLGFGEFKSGGQGRGNIGHFKFNDKCPEYFSMKFSKKVKLSSP